MIKKGKFYKILILTSIFVSIITWHINNYVMYRTNDAMIHRFRSVAGIIQKYGLDNPGSDSLQIGSINGMINSTSDKENLYLTSSMIKEYNLKPNRESFSIGIKTSKVIDYFLVTFVDENSYAYNIGIRAGDLIQSINKKSCKEYYSLGELIDNKKDILLNVKRDNDNLDFFIEKKIIKNHDLLHMHIYNEENNINNKIINLQDFDCDNISDMLFKSIELLNNNLECNKIIIDLRNNTSFSLETSQKIINKIIRNNSKNTPYMYIQNKKQIQEENNAINSKKRINKLEYLSPYYSEQKEIFIKKPITVLLNQNSYSAAEILASSLKNIESAKIVGQRSYGRGRIDEMIPIFTDDTSLKIATHNWYTSNLENLDNTKGITPDVVIEDPLPFKINFISAIKTYVKGDKDETFEIKTVKKIKRFLKYLGYSLDNDNDYFDNELYEVIIKFQTDSNIEKTGKIDANTIIKINKYLLEYTSNKKNDLCLNKAID